MLFEVPPPGAGFAAEMFRVADTDKDSVGTFKTSWFGDTNTVVAGRPFINPLELERKFAPATITRVAAAPASITEGLTDARVGTKLPTTNDADAAPPPGVGLLTIIV
jgi:hypothetical protein